MIAIGYSLQIKEKTETIEYKMYRMIKYNFWVELTTFEFNHIVI